MENQKETKNSAKCMEKYIGIKLFVAALSIYALGTGTFSSYYSSILTTLEKRFGFSSSTTGFLMTVDNYIYFPGIIFSHFARRSHTPRIFFGSSIAVAISMLLWATPFFIYGSKGGFNPEFSAKNTTQDNSSESTLFCRMGPAGNTTHMNCDSEDMKNEHENKIAYSLFVVAQLFYGVGTCSFWTLGTTYIDDNASRKDLSFFLGVLFTLKVIGPVVGYYMGAAVLLLPEDLTSNGIGPEEAGYIGAWWLGFPIMALVMILGAIPMLMIPRKMEVEKSYKDVDDDNDDADDENGLSLRNAVTDIKDLPKSLLRILLNPVFMGLTCSICFFVFWISGYSAFQPKYIQEHFNVSATTANVLTGSMGALAGAVGSFISGVGASRFKATKTRVMRIIVYNMVIVLIASASSLAFICPQTEIVGLNERGNGTCSEDCNCDDSAYSPVCGDDNLNYMSACHAGCTALNNGTYDNCQCTGGGTVTFGLCSAFCNMAIPYAIMAFIASFFHTLQEVPLYRIQLRCVAKDDRALSIGIMNFIIFLTALPSPVVFGVVVDSACLLQMSSCSSTDSACWVYATDPMRFKLHILMVAFLILEIISFIFMWYKCKSADFLYDDPEPESETKTKGDLETAQPLMTIKDQKGDLETVLPKKNQSTL
ncbi:unnamed protein product [Owenia fusiformis]|uniref:Solute carrier organic anion transporter family member n=1 Tax=Owenia fusiformis TaxID=6347 RepID=A0A8J1TCT3_OWEFU|nr:unnamed protein product [Owenia fusiformis]